MPIGYHQTLSVANHRNSAHYGVRETETLSTSCRWKAGPQGFPGISTRFASSRFARVNALRRARRSGPQEGRLSLRPPTASAATPVESASVLLDIPGKGLLPLADSDLLAFPSVNQPCSFGECHAFRLQLTTLTKHQGRVAPQTPKPGKKVGGYEAIPSHKYPIQDSTCKSET